MASQAITQIPGLNALASVRQMVPLSQGKVYLFQGDRDVLHTAMQEFINRFGMRGAVQVVVGGNRISFDHLSLILGDQIGSVYEIMDRILASRAETCYQMQDVLAALEPGLVPLVITDMLESFYEEDLTPKEVTMLLQKCIRHIHRLSQSAPVLIGADGDLSRPALLKLLEQNSDERFYFQPFEEGEKVVQIKMSGM